MAREPIALDQKAPEVERYTTVTRTLYDERDDGCWLTNGTTGRCGDPIAEEHRLPIDDAGAVIYFGYCAEHEGFNDD